MYTRSSALDAGFFLKLHTKHGNGDIALTRHHHTMTRTRVKRASIAKQQRRHSDDSQYVGLHIYIIINALTMTYVI